MGVIQSIFCSITFCFERVLTWTCCAVVLMLLMFSIVILMIYGVSVGYHYAQKELASFAMSSRVSTEAPALRSGAEADARPVVRLVAVNKTQVERQPAPMLEVYRTKSPSENLYLEGSDTPIVLLQTEKPPKQPELSPHERELARRLIGRFRRSKNNTSTSIPFFRPVKNSHINSVLLSED